MKFFRFAGAMTAANVAIQAIASAAVSTHPPIPAPTMGAAMMLGPEPSTFLLLGVGFLFAGISRIRRTGK